MTLEQKARQEIDQQLEAESLEDSADLRSPDVLAQEIADDLETALEQFQSFASPLRE